MRRRLATIIAAGLGLFPATAFAGGSDDAFRGKLPSARVPVFRRDTFNVLGFGAKADGVFLNTEAINRAIQECSAKGGGVVHIPQGLWSTGPIVMRSNVNLNLAAGALLLFTKDYSQYPLVEGNWEGQPNARSQSPISGDKLTNIAITGKGIIDGNGDVWRQVKRDKLTESEWKRKTASGGIVSEDGRTWYPNQESLDGSKTKDAGVLGQGKTLNDYQGIKTYLRPNLLVLTSCRNILLEGVTFQNSPAWCLHPLMCEDLTVRDLTVKNPWYAQNGDGIDLESCRNVVIENSTFDVGDDGICIKSGRDEAGRKRGMPTENVLVKGCTVYHAHGGFVIGSEMSGGARNLYVTDCTFIGTDLGLRFKTTRGRGGIVEKIYVRNLAMKDIVGAAILFDMYYMAKDPILLAGEKGETPKVETVAVTEATPQFRDFYISNISCSGAEKALFVRGLPEMAIRNINLENLTITASRGIEITEGRDIRMKNVQVYTRDNGALVKVYNSGGLSFDNLRYKGNTQLFEIAGTRSADIRVRGTNTAAAPSSFNDGADKQSLIIE